MPVGGPRPGVAAVTPRGPAAPHNLRRPRHHRRQSLARGLVLLICLQITVTNSFESKRAGKLFLLARSGKLRGTLVRRFRVTKSIHP